MKAIDFVRSKYPKASAFHMIDNRRRQMRYVILKHGTFQDWTIVGTEIFPNEGARTASKAWTNAKKEILKSENKLSTKN
jgi:hypothetical protein